jgi:hypothetical protein
MQAGEAKSRDGGNARINLNLRNFQSDFKKKFMKMMEAR